METLDMFDARLEQLETENAELRQENASLLARMSGNRIRGSRGSDKATSKMAAGLNPKRRQTQRAAIAMAFTTAEALGGLNSDEAAIIAGIPHTSSPWKRVSELAECGWLVDTDTTRLSPLTNRPQTVYRMPDAKLNELDSWGWLS